MVVSRDHYKNILDCGRVSKLQNLKFLSSKNIDKLTNLSGEEVYTILQELTGTKVYIEKKQESLHILEKTSEEQ